MAGSLQGEGYAPQHMRHPRVVILTSIMAPHRIASFNALAAVEDLDLEVIYVAESEPNRQWRTDEDQMRFRHRMLRERKVVRRGDSYTHLSAGVIRALRDSEPDVVVAGGWDQAAYLFAYVARRILRARFLWWVESNLRDRRPEGQVLSRVKRRLVRRADGVVVPGHASREYVLALGGHPDRVWIAPNAVDNHFYRGVAGDRSGRQGPAQVLFVGRLESAKGLLTLLDAWSLMRDDPQLTLVGTGSLDRAVAERARTATTPSLRMLGHLQRNDLAKRYAEADVFVFPSLSDPWGLVINEAMASGLPVIASSVPGAVDDLVQHGRNGFVVEPLDARSLGDAIATLVGDSGLRLRMGQESSRIVAGFEPSAWAEGMFLAVTAATSG